jgi:hypothetical protein
MEEKAMAAGFLRRVAMPVGLLLAGTVATPLQAGHPGDRTDEDPLPLESQWKGKLTQRGATPDGGLFPLELNAVLTITQRRDNEFEAELREYSGNLDITFLVRGRIAQGAGKNLVLTFQSHDVKGVPNAAIYYLNVPYTANLGGEQIKGAWTYEEKEKEKDTALSGEFHLKRSSE